MNKYLILMRNHPTITRLFAADFLCYFGTWFVQTAIFALLVDLNAPVWILSTTAAVGFLAGVFIAPFSGAIIDSVDTKKLLLFGLACEVISAFILLFFNSLSWIWFLFFLLMLRFWASTLYFQATMSVFPKLLKDDELKLANELNSINWSLSYTSGMALAGIFVHFCGFKASIIINIILYFLAIYIIFKTQIPSMISNVKILNNIKEGALYLKQNKILMHLILLHSAIALTSYDALVALLAKFNYPLILTSALIIGLINTSRSVGLIIGASFLSRFVNTKNLYLFFIFQACGLFIWALLSKDFYLGLLGTFCAGFCTTILWSFTYTQIQAHTKGCFYGRVIAYTDMIFLLFSALVSFGIGLVFKAGLGTFGIMILLGMLFLCFSFYSWWIFKKLIKSA